MPNDPKSFQNATFVSVAKLIPLVALSQSLKSAFIPPGPVTVGLYASPFTTKEYGFFVTSLFGIEIIASLVPVDNGINLTIKTAVPPGLIVEAERKVIAKSGDCNPV